MIKITLPKKKIRKKKTPGGAGVLAIDMGGKILVGKRSQAVKYPGQWGLPGGSLEKGERFVDAAIREFKEEAGYEGEYRIVDSFSFTRAKDAKVFKVFVFVLPFLTPGVVQNTETEKFAWVRFPELLDRTPMHWVLQKTIASGYITPVKIEEYVELVGQEEAYFNI